MNDPFALLPANLASLADLTADQGSHYGMSGILLKLEDGSYEACATKKVFPVQWCLMVTDGVRTEAMTSEQCPMNQRMTNGGVPGPLHCYNHCKH